VEVSAVDAGYDRCRCAKPAFLCEGIRLEAV
jgi:hypothetical protein